MISFELFGPGKRLPADYWTRDVPGARRTEIEVGPGSGRFLIEAAERDRATVWVGLEIRTGLARTLMERSDLPTNLRIHHCDARWVIEHLVAPASIDAFHLYFPDPWWKKRHQKRSFLAGPTIEALVKCVKPGGVVYLLTDVEAIFSEAAARLCAAGLRQEPWSRVADDPAQSSYERKYRRQGRRLFQAKFIRSAG